MNKDSRGSDFIRLITKARWELSTVELVQLKNALDYVSTLIIEDDKKKREKVSKGKNESKSK